jgi:hypothetical protein
VSLAPNIPTRCGHPLFGTLKKQGKVVDAREFARRAVIGQRNVLDPGHPDIKKSQELYQQLTQKK